MEYVRDLPQHQVQRRELIAAISSDEARRARHAYLAQNRRYDPSYDLDIGQIWAVGRLREAAQDVEDLLVSAAMSQPNDERPSFELLGEGLAMSRQGARRRAKVAEERRRRLLESLGTIEQPMLQQASTPCIGVDGLRTIVAILDGLSEVMRFRGADDLRQQLREHADALAAYLEVHPGGETSQPARQQGRNAWTDIVQRELLRSPAT